MRLIEPKFKTCDNCGEKVTEQEMCYCSRKQLCFRCFYREKLKMKRQRLQKNGTKTNRREKTFNTRNY